MWREALAVVTLSGDPPVGGKALLVGTYIKIEKINR